MDTQRRIEGIVDASLSQIVIGYADAYRQEPQAKNMTEEQIADSSSDEVNKVGIFDHDIPNFIRAIRFMSNTAFLYVPDYKMRGVANLVSGTCLEYGNMMRQDILEGFTVPIERLDVSEHIDRFNMHYNRFQRGESAETILATFSNLTVEDVMPQIGKAFESITRSQIPDHFGVAAALASVLSVMVSTVAVTTRIDRKATIGFTGHLPPHYIMPTQRLVYDVTQTAMTAMLDRTDTIAKEAFAGGNPTEFMLSEFARAMYAGYMFGFEPDHYPVVNVIPSTDIYIDKLFAGIKAL